MHSVMLEFLNERKITESNVAEDVRIKEEKNNINPIANKQKKSLNYSSTRLLLFYHAFLVSGVLHFQLSSK